LSAGALWAGKRVIEYINYTSITNGFSNIGHGVNKSFKCFNLGKTYRYCMFKNIFSFDGRIRRTEFGISYIICCVSNIIIELMADGDNGVKLFLLFFIPVIWFLWAQGAKRCHDLGNSGWYQIIPFYVLWLLFQEGRTGANEYGENPKMKKIYGEEDYFDPLPIANDTNEYISGGENEIKSN
jgi:uncharacterized membrane protein YhaH (DUF805 family)